MLLKNYNAHSPTKRVRLSSNSTFDLNVINESDKIPVFKLKPISFKRESIIIRKNIMAKLKEFSIKMETKEIDGMRLSIKMMPYRHQSYRPFHATENLT